MEPEFWETCPTCQGEGEIGTGVMSHAVNTATIDAPWELSERCSTCGGCGYIQSELGEDKLVEKVKTWWSDDGKWFCMLVNDGVNQATVSLTRAEARAIAVDINDPARPPDNSLCDCGAMNAPGEYHGVHSPACEALRL